MDITSWLNLTANVGLDEYNTKTSTRFAKGSAGDAPTYALYNGNRDGSDGYYDESLNGFYETNMDMMLGFRKNIGTHFKTSFNIGGNRMYQKTSFDFRAILV